MACIIFILPVGLNFLLGDTEFYSKAGLQLQLREDTNQSKLKLICYILYIYIYIYIYIYTCKVKAKTTKILKCIKTLLTVKTLKIYTTFCCQRQLDHVYSNVGKILVKV